MIARLFALKLFVAILLTSCVTTTKGDPRDLDNDCGIIAAEAYARLKPAAYWVRIFAFRAIVTNGNATPETVRHIITAYQYNKDSSILLFDRSGTAEIPTKSHDLPAIVKALEQAAHGMIVLDARFLSQ